MTAGRGITHSERLEKARREGGRVYGIQSWVALPAADEEMAPAFAHHDSEDLPLLDNGDARGRLLAGSAYGLRASVETRSPLFYAHWTLAPGATAELPGDHAERAAYIVEGDVDVGGDIHQAGRMLVFRPGGAVALRATAPTTLMLLGGEPLGPRFIDWNFVSSSKQRIEQAKADWRAGRMKLPDLDNQEFVPLPE
jgi:redox-sensitive bicupin YhaK (pirin superfamily)